MFYCSTTTTLATLGFSLLQTPMRRTPRMLYLTGVQLSVRQEDSCLTDRLGLEMRRPGSSPKAYKRPTFYTVLLPMEQRSRRPPPPQSVTRCAHSFAQAQATLRPMAGSGTAFPVRHQSAPIATPQKHRPNRRFYRPQTHPADFVIHVLRHRPRLHFV